MFDSGGHPTKVRPCVTYPQYWDSRAICGQDTANEDHPNWGQLEMGTPQRSSQMRPADKPFALRSAPRGGANQADMSHAALRLDGVHRDVSWLQARRPGV
jgi:hypothetical protein